MAAKIRIVLIAPSLDILGGQSVQASALLKALDQVSDLDVRFLPINPRLGWIERIKLVRTAVRFLLYTPRLLWIVPRSEILHIFSAGMPSFFLWTAPAVLIGRLFRKKVVINYHDGRLEAHPARSRLGDRILRMATTIITPSPYLVEVFARYGFSAKSIFNLIDLNKFQYRRRGKLRPVLMTNRSLEPVYNVDCALRAFAIVQRRYPDATLTIAHDGPCRAALEQLARELGLNHARFIGAVPHSKVPELYQQADIYFTTPNADNMPLSLLECYASGVPVVATRAGGIPHIATHEETALLTELNDHEAIAASCIRLLESEILVTRLTEQARAQLVKYQPERLREEWAQLYRQLVNRR